MSAEVIIIIVGAILVLLAIADSIKSLSLLNAKTRIPLGVIGVLLIIYGGFSYGSINLQGQIEQVEIGKKLKVQYPVEKIQVISPIQGDSVQCRILTMGIYPKSHDKDIWVLLKPSDEKYYPQSDHTNTSYKRDGEWQVITRFGGDKGESYDVIVYETDSIASNFFSATIQKWKDALAYPGLEMEELPKGAIEADRLTVSLKDGCRGVF